MSEGNSVGVKSSVVKRKASKKRRGFQGLPKWKQEAKKQQPNDVSQLTFVPDSEVGFQDDESEIPHVSASKRKLQTTQ